MLVSRTIKKQDNLQQVIYQRVERKKLSQKLNIQNINNSTNDNNQKEGNTLSQKENLLGQQISNIGSFSSKAVSNTHNITKQNTLIFNTHKNITQSFNRNQPAKRMTLQVTNGEKQQFNRKSLAIINSNKTPAVAPPTSKLLLKKQESNPEQQLLNEFDEQEKCFWREKINKVISSQESQLISNSQLNFDFLDVNQSFAQGGLILQEELIKNKIFIKYLSISLPKRSISEITMQQITSSLGKLKLFHLRMDLMYSYLNQKSLRFLETYFNKQNTLIKIQLNLKWCKINLRKLDIIATSLLYKDRLQIIKMDLSCNEIGAKGFSILFERACEYPNLINFEGDFTMNEIKGDGLSKSARYFKRMKNLEQLSLNLKMNEIDDKGFSNFSNALQNMEKLKYLDLQLQTNNISFEGITSFTQSICSLNNLLFLMLNVYENSIPRERFEYFTKEIVNLKNLMHLDLIFERCIMQQRNLVCHVDKEINIITSFAHSIINTRKTPYIPFIKACQSIKYSKLKKLFRAEILHQIIQLQI